MSYKKAEYYVYITERYDDFKRLKGNRGVSEHRISKIMESIENVGYIRNPITVNEKMEVIDGQGRLEALKRLEKEVEFVIDEGAGIDECISMNIYGTNWDTQDYIDSYAEQGNENYRNLKQLQAEYPDIALSAIAFATGNCGRITDMKDGTYKCSKKIMASASAELEYINKLIPFIDEVGGRTDILQTALIFIKRDGKADADRMKKKFKESYTKIAPIGNTEGTMRALEDLYNRGLHVNRMSFWNDYKEYEGRRKAEKRKGSE